MLSKRYELCSCLIKLHLINDTNFSIFKIKLDFNLMETGCEQIAVNRKTIAPH